MTGAAVDLLSWIVRLVEIQRTSLAPERQWTLLNCTGSQIYGSVYDFAISNDHRGISGQEVAIYRSAQRAVWQIITQLGGAAVAWPPRRSKAPRLL
jgi:hypothetical protein